MLKVTTNRLGFEALNQNAIQKREDSLDGFEGSLSGLYTDINLAVKKQGGQFTIERKASSKRKGEGLKRKTSVRGMFPIFGVCKMFGSKQTARVPSRVQSEFTRV